MKAMRTQVIDAVTTRDRWGGGPWVASQRESAFGDLGGSFMLMRLGLLAAALSLPIWVMSPLDFVKFGDIKFEYIMGIAVMAAGMALVELGRGGFGYRTSPWLWGLGALMLFGLMASLTAADPVVAVNGTLLRRDGFLHDALQRDAVPDGISDGSGRDDVGSE